MASALATCSPRDVLDFWLGQHDPTSFADDQWTSRWWKKDPALDEEIRGRFASTYEAIVTGKLDTWLDQPLDRVAYIIVLDQFARNMFRDTAKMYTADPMAVAAALQGIDGDAHRELTGDTRIFLYMPLMHAEDLALQDRCVALFEAFAAACPDQARPRVASNHKYAILHRDIVKRFGRFPHRNALLGRTSTPEELEFLTQPGSAF